MPKNTIDNPKVFISYAWGSEEYQEKVLAFASSLVGDGIDVILDKWDLSEGNDTYAFMEKCATDTSITNVLMLLDPVYAQKADDHSGGVGTETQIISHQVYREVEQDKFIPIVFERNDKGEICKPTYLQGRLHFDLTHDEKYDSEYQRLVRRLFGRETYEKPQIGNKPAWVDELPHTSFKALVSYEVLKKGENPRVKQDKFVSFLNDIKRRIIEYTHVDAKNYNDMQCIEIYAGLHDIRDSYLQLIQYFHYIEASEQYIAEIFENIYNKIYYSQDPLLDFKLVFLHELFIYSIATMLNLKDYSCAGYLLCKTYFRTQEKHPFSFHVFYSASHHTSLDNAVCKKDNKQYYSGTANYWITNLNTSVCTKEEFVFADLLCYNCSVLGNVQQDYWSWFPLTYIYDNRYNSVIKNFAIKLSSKENMLRVLPLFGYDNQDDFIDRIVNIETQIKNGQHRQVRYSSAFEVAPLICYYINSETLGTLR